MIYFHNENKMPAVSFYLPEDVLKAVREEARARRTSVSRFIRTSVESCLDVEARNKAKSEFLRSLRDADLGSWEGTHEDRDEDSRDRG